MRKLAILIVALLIPLAAAAEHLVVTGVVERYEPQKTIVLRTLDDHVVTYSLSPAISVPVRVEPGMHIVMEADVVGNRPTVIKTVRTVSPVTQQVIVGKVSTLSPRQYITVVRPDGSETTLLLRETTAVPRTVAVGKQVRLVVSQEQPIVVDRVVEVESKLDIDIDVDD